MMWGRSVEMGPRFRGGDGYYEQNQKYSVIPTKAGIHTIARHAPLMATGPAAAQAAARVNGGAAPGQLANPANNCDSLVASSKYCFIAVSAKRC
jgi:hypothetical protein